MSRKDRFREWVSDNLRYMLLILAIVAVVGLGILIVHLVTSGSDDGEAEPKAEVTATPDALRPNRSLRLSHRAASRRQSLQRRITPR